MMMPFNHDLVMHQQRYKSVLVPSSRFRKGKSGIKGQSGGALLKVTVSLSRGSVYSALWLLLKALRMSEKAV